MQSDLEHSQMVQDLMSALIDVLADHPGEAQHDAVLYRASAWLKSRQQAAKVIDQEVKPLTSGHD